MDRRIWILALVTTSAACGWTSDESEPVEPANVQAERSLNVAVESATDMTGQRVLAEGAAGAAGVDTNLTARGLEQVGVAIGDSIEATTALPGRDPCHLAYDADVAERTTAGASTPTESTRDAYLAACSSLPEDARRCLVPDYAARNEETCAAVLGREDVRGGADSLHAMLAR